MPESVPALQLDEREQRALRTLLSCEPCPGSPLPSRTVLEQLSVLLPADEVGAVFQDGNYRLTQYVALPHDPYPPDPDESHRGPHYLGIMHWARHPLAAQACIGGLKGGADGLAIGFRNGSDSIVQIAFDRHHTGFTDRDVAMLRMLAPLIARLVRERPTPALPATLTTQERRVLSHVAAGKSNGEIAQALFIAPSTVRKHLEHAFRKLGVTSRTAAVARLQGRDLPDLDLRERLTRLG